MKLGLFSNNEPIYKNEAKKIIKILRKSKIKFEVCSNKKAKYDILIVVGGDGTIFRAAKEYPNTALLSIKRLKIPFSAALEKIKKGKYKVEKITRLEAKYKNFKSWGINDISVLRDDECASRFRIFINGRDAFGDELIGDGIIVATAYGSTGYNWTAGGSVLKENEKKFVVKPICSAYFNKRYFVKNRNVMKRVEKSKIIPDNKEIIVKFSRGSENKIVPDGRKEERFYANIKAGEKILIRKTKENSKFVKIL
jgi:NAD+ kinase